MILFAVTHINMRLGLRQLTFANRGGNHFATADEAQRMLNVTKPQLVSRNILTPQEGDTMEIRPVDCYHHGDAKGIYFDDPATDD